MGVYAYLMTWPITQERLQNNYGMKGILQVLPGQSGRPWNNKLLRLQEVKVVATLEEKLGFHCCKLSALSDQEFSSNQTEPHTQAFHKTFSSYSDKLNAGEENLHQIPQNSSPCSVSSSTLQETDP